MDMVGSEHPLAADLRRAQWRLASLEAEHADLDTRHATLSVELNAFRRVYLQRLGPLFAVLDSLRARLAALRAAKSPTDVSLRQEAEEAEQQARRSAHEASSEGVASPGESPRFKVDDRCKELRRKAAKLLHPDRAETDADRDLRNRLMAEVNRAMRDNDAERIQEIIDEYVAKSDVTPDSDDIEERLATIRRRSEKLELRIAAIRNALRSLTGSELCVLRDRVVAGEKAGNDVFSEIEQELAAQISGLELEIAKADHGAESNTGAKNSACSQSSDASNSSEQCATVAEASNHAEEEEVKDFRSNGLRHRTATGDFVRSKSEVIIADALYRHGITYQYEGRLTVSGRRVRPDFLIRRGGGRPIVWEHLGMLVDARYRNAWEKKEKAYLAEGYKRGIDLIVSEDGVDGGIDSWKIDLLVKELRERISTDDSEYIVLDFETSGTSPNNGARVIEIAAIRCAGQKIVKTFSTLVDPGIDVPDNITEITGISTRMLRDAPTPEEAFARLSGFIRSSPLIAHNASFDRTFLRSELELVGGKSSPVVFACTLKLARRVWPHFSSHKLGALAEKLDLSASGSLHRALADADLTAKLWLRIVDECLSSGQLASVQDVYREGRLK